MKQQRDTLKQKVEDISNELERINSLKVTSVDLVNEKKRLVEDMATKKSMINDIEATLNLKMGTTTFSELGDMSEQEVDEVIEYISINEMVETLVQSPFMTRFIAGMTKSDNDCLAF